MEMEKISMGKQRKSKHKFGKMKVHSIFENGYWNVLAEISDFICFKIKVVFTPSSYNVSASCIIIYNILH